MQKLWRKRDREWCLSPSLSVAARPFWTAGRHDQPSSDPAGAPSQMHRTDLVHKETDHPESWEQRARNRRIYWCYMVFWVLTWLKQQNELSIKQNERDIITETPWTESNLRLCTPKNESNLVPILQAYRSDPDTKSATGNKKKLKSNAACIYRTYANKSHVEKTEELTRSTWYTLFQLSKQTDGAKHPKIIQTKPARQVRMKQQINSKTGKTIEHASNKYILAYQPQERFIRERS
jgi:hypothetical protein